MSYLLQLNEAARLTPNHLLKKQLRDCASDLRRAVDALAADVTEDNGKAVVACFARGWRLLQRAKNTTPPGGRGGAKKEGARLAA